ncbi:gamma-glutamylcyclotransferase [Vibrio owensii]|uniref:gamma-glutamylcyclotransferase n=1 Tax=Vibrio owensii TaxID=696485 RepID=UPI003CE51F9E
MKQRNALSRRVYHFTYPLYLVGERNSPWLILDSTKGSPIKGQIFSVSTDALLKMDELERNHESGGYSRVKIDIINQETSEVLKVFLYGKPKLPLEHIDIRAELTDEHLLEHATLYRSQNSSTSL